MGIGNQQRIGICRYRSLGVFMVCVTLFIAVIRKKTCLPKWACLVNTIFFTMVAGIVFAGMGAMNVGSSLMFLGLFFLMRKHNYGVHMTIDTNTMVSITEANQNFSKVARLVDELGSVVILKNNAPRYLVIDFSKADESAVAKEEDVLEVSKRLLAQNKEAYEVLDK